jgi:hypothetical protein
MRVAEVLSVLTVMRLLYEVSVKIGSRIGK